ncbi:hypothetical protein Mapa_011039 [Marchantia paleacea]|nr:hypothetical protein Mapa_011039 [Marchantia paleacea]
MKTVCLHLFIVALQAASSSGPWIVDEVRREWNRPRISSQLASDPSIHDQIAGICSLLQNKPAFFWGMRRMCPHVLISSPVRRFDVPYSAKSWSTAPSTPLPFPARIKGLLRKLRVPSGVHDVEAGQRSFACRRKSNLSLFLSVHTSVCEPLGVAKLELNEVFESHFFGLGPG